MRTIQIINCKWYNATFWYAMYLTKILNEHGHKSLLVTIPDSVGIDELEKINIDFQTLPLNSHLPKDIFYSAKEFSRLCKEFKPDIVNCHRGESFYLFSFLKDMLNYKLVRTRGDQRKPKATFLNKYFHNVCADALISSNSAMTEYFLQAMHSPKEKLFTILGGVDTAIFFPQKEKKMQIRNTYGFAEDAVLLGIIGRLDSIKGFHETILAFHKAMQQSELAQKKLHLLIAGKACDFSNADLKKFCIEHAVPLEHIHFYSYIQDMNSFMNMLDMGVIASLGSETIARVAFELLACHTPIIGSIVGVMPDILDKEYLFAPANIDEMANLFIKVLDEDFRKKALQSTLNKFYNKNTVCPYYGWTLEDFYNKTIQVYSDLLNN